MDMRNLHVLLVLTMFVGAAENVWSQNPYVRDGAIGGSTKQVQSGRAFEMLGIRDCVGKRFIFLPSAGLGRDFGYQSFLVNTYSRKSVPYDSVVGRTATLIGF